MKIEVVGTIFGSSGYDSHTRQLVNALYNEGVDIALSTNLPQGWERMVNDNELKMITNNKDKLDYRLLIALPTTAPLYWNDNVPILQYCIWEGDRIPAKWINILLDDRIKYIIVPSYHTLSAVLFSGELKGDNATTQLQHKLKVVPHGVDLALFYPKEKEQNRPFTFLANKGWPNGSKDRGGLSFLIKAFVEEFTFKDNVQLLVKVNGCYGMNDITLNKNMKELNIQKKDVPKLAFIFDNIPYEKLVEFYSKGDVFVISSLAESFHLGGIEAMACGLPVLYTTFGGQLDYCNEKNGWRLEQGKTKEVDWDVMYENVKWKLPNINEIRKELRFIYDNQEQVKEKSINAIKTVGRFTWKNSAKKLIEAIS